MSDEKLEENKVTNEDDKVKVPASDNSDAESQEEELPPPEEENEAKEPNMGNIIGLIVIGVIVVFGIAFFAMNSGKKKTKDESTELDKAGTKTVIEFKDKNPVDFFSSNTDADTNFRAEEPEADFEETADPLPVEFQLPVQGQTGKAPVSSVGSTGNSSYKSDRPDTKNSKSPRKIEGLAALDYSSQNSSTNSISSILNGTYNTANGKMSKEEFIAQQMAQTQNLQNSLYGSGSSGSSSYSSGGDKENFFNSSQGNAGNGTYLSTATLWDGTIISAALITAINTDNPGVVMARVTENVYSSQDHSYLLIPEGSVLMATYNSSVSYGQKQVQVAWNLLIRPDNYRIQLGNMNGVNAQGASGYSGYVSNHPFETLKALGMVAVYSIIQTEISNDINSENNEYLQNAMSDVYTEASKLGNKIVDKALDIKPTIKIKEGTEIKLITNVPLELPPVEVHNATQKYVRTR